MPSCFVVCLLMRVRFTYFFFFFFFNDPATTEIYTLPYTTLFRSSCARTRRAGTSPRSPRRFQRPSLSLRARHEHVHRRGEDRKSTRLNSSHVAISYAVFCLKKKKNKKNKTPTQLQTTMKT